MNKTTSPNLIPSLNFMMYESMKLTLDDICGEGITAEAALDAVMDKAIDKAFDDATNQKAFKGNVYSGKKDADKPILKAAIAECKAACREKLVSFVKDSIRKSAHGMAAAEYDNDHNGLCKDICVIFAACPGRYLDDEQLFENWHFSYGNAQKWVNMTMKYLYLIDSIVCVIEPEKSLGVAPMANMLHIPVDSYIIEKVWGLEAAKNAAGELAPEDSCLPIITDKLCKGPKGPKSSYGAYSAEKVKPWSQWNYDDYLRFIEGVWTLIDGNLIDWEGPAWIEIAKSRA